MIEKEITSAFGLLARFEGEKVNYLQFLEDSYGTAGSFKTGGATRFHSDPSGKKLKTKSSSKSHFDWEFKNGQSDE